MDQICRFCLKVSNKNMCSLQEWDIILCDIKTFLKIQISTEDSFPNNLCEECYIKISQTIKFCKTVKENEEKLQQYSINGSLQDYYFKLTNNMAAEQNGCIFFESKHLKIEDSNINKISEIDTHINERINSSSIIKEEILNFDDSFKHEDLVDNCNKTNYSTDDEITLSSIKKEKELNTIIPLKSTKKITPQKRIKKSKRKNKSEPQNIEHEKQFTCLTCLKPNDSQTDLIKHYYDEHLNNKNTPKNYTECKLDGRTTYSCESCDGTFKLKKEIVRHVTSHSDERPLICKLCGRTYKTVTEIVRHARAHNGFRLQCPLNCGFSTAYQGAMKEHERRHLDVHKYTCKECGKGFNIRTWYEQHQNVHAGLKPFVCDLCGLAFHMDRYLQTHRNSLHPQSSSVKRYICVHCDQKCDSANSLAIHLQEHGIKKETDFLCDFCGKTLSSAYQLSYHHRMHLGVKPYTCTVCNKTFAKKYNVKLHMSIHSGEKSHSCAHCGKQYTQRSTLLRHLKRYHSSSSPKRTR